MNSNKPSPRRPIPKHAVKTAEVLYQTQNHALHEDEHHEEPSEKWLVAYADLMTLLFGFFVLMYSMSNVDSEKFAAAAESASERFGGSYQDPTAALDRGLSRELASLPGLTDEIEVTKGHMGLEINFRGRVLFESGRAELSSSGNKILSAVAQQIKESGGQFTVRVEGHTDDVPISTIQFPSNWELSASRAIQVVKLFRSLGIEENRLEAIGYADTRPMLPNRSPAGEGIAENRSQNRRVMVRIQRVFQQ